MWKLLTSSKVNVTLTDLEERWSIDDLQDAYDMVEAIEEAEGRAAAYAKARSKSR